MITDKNIARITGEISAVCPIHGVNSEGIISFKDGATVSQKAAANAIVDAQMALPDTPTTAEIVASLTAAVQKHLDDTAKARGYDGILSACTYATDTHPPFQAEGQACVNWRGAVWGACYTTMAAVQAGTHAMPTSESLIAELPSITWP